MTCIKLISLSLEDNHDPASQVSAANHQSFYLISHRDVGGGLSQSARLEILRSATVPFDATSCCLYT